LYLYLLVFLGKYDVMLAIAVVLSNNIWCLISMLCSNNADCVKCFSLISYWYSFIRKLTILPISPMYLPAGTKYFIYSELRFLKIFGISSIVLRFVLDGLKIRILCLFNILPIRFVVPLTYGRMDRIFSSCMSETVLFACLHVDCFDYVFFVVSVFL